MIIMDKQPHLFPLHGAYKMHDVYLLQSSEHKFFKLEPVCYFSDGAS